jgi:hypothetical protein
MSFLELGKPGLKEAWAKYLPTIWLSEKVFVAVLAAVGFDWDVWVWEVWGGVALAEDGCVGVGLSGVAGPELAPGF